MPTINEELLYAQVRHAIDIERYKTGTVRKMISLLNKSEASLISQITARLALIEERGFDTGPATTRRLEELYEVIQRQREEAYKIVNDRMTSEMEGFAEVEAEFQTRLPVNVGAAVEVVAPSAVVLNKIVNAQPFRGKLMRDWIAGLEADEVARIKETIQIGITEGQTLDQMVRKIRGTRAARYTDGVLEIGRRQAESVVLTAVAHVQNRAKMEVYDANADIVSMLQYRATLDSKTTVLCASRDGKTYKRTNAPVLPAHWRCRSILIAYFKDFEKGKRASINGPVPAEMTYSDFLKKQPVEFQNKVLGVKKAQLFRAGTPIDKFVDKSGQVYTLAELKRQGVNP